MSVPGPRAVIALLVLLFVAAALQGAFSARLYRWGGQPDFIFTVVMCAALLSDAGLGALLGLAGGLMTAALVGETVGTFLFSRTIAGFVAGALSARLFRANIGVIMLSIVAASAVAQILYILSAPQVGLMPWLRSTLVGAGWNALLAIPATIALRRFGWGPEPG